MTPEYGRLAVVGAGSWGTALAIAVARNFESVVLLAHDPATVAEAAEWGENRKYLPGIQLPGNVRIVHAPEDALVGAEIVLLAVPSAYLRGTLEDLRDRIPPDALLISATKGLEPGTKFRMSEVIGEATGVSAERILVLSGPSFAVEVARGLPCAVVAAGRNEPAHRVQNAFAGPALRVYSTEDVVGVEIGGALKNVVALGAGMATGLALGHNSVAALITRGLAEITRLATAMGAQPRTLAGLAGLGDLVLTCTSELSRNRQLGIRLTEGNSASEVLKTTRYTTEGVRSAGVAVQLGEHFGVEMPIALEMHAVLQQKHTAPEAMRRLMDRSLKEE